MTRSIPLVALAALVLSGCAGLGGFGDRYGDRRHDDYGGYYEDDRYYGDRYADSRYYRVVERDARRYADELDRYLRISGREERAVRELLEYRTYELLDRVHVRDHDRVYPFPRRYGRAERFWAQADRDIQRILDRRYHEPYAYYNRYGADRYREYYRYRRYDDRRGWYDTRRTPRRATEAREDHREDVREARRRAERREAREDRRREEAREEAREERREARRERDPRRRADQDRERRAEEARQDRRRDQRTAPRRGNRDDADRRRADREDDEREAGDRRRSRRGNGG